MNKRAVYIFFAIATACIAILFWETNRLREMVSILEAPTASKAEHEEEEEHEHEGEIAVHMGQFQRWAGKLWLAGQQENWELADFYAHELEEAIEALEDEHAEEGGKDINKLLDDMFKPSFEAMEASVKAKDGTTFPEKYQNMVTSCNGCHAVTEHAFIKIMVPAEQDWSNQDFSK